MMKRILSFLLCLIMVVGLAAPSVQASSTDDVITSDNIMDNIVIDDGANVDIVIDGERVNTSQETKLPNPVDLMTKEEDLPYTFGTPIAEEPAVEQVCECVDLASAVEHSGVCLVKAPYMTICEASVAELFTQWDNYTLVEQTFLLSYLQEKFPLKHYELEKLLNAPIGSASETYADGTTVSVEGIPQDGSLTVGEAADEVQEIVDAYVAEKEEASTPLFSYDVSVQDGEGADWQPETNVKMELELPGEKLHKNTKVFVVHVDDDGVATTIEATVTEDGKIAFETPGFSAFYGFTVDFHYEDVTFSIPGMSSIKLSELFEELKMPLNASDVVALDYTDDTQLKIEQLEGDWLLTSLKAFDTEEKLTMTMTDGAVYEIKVTDEGTTVTWDVYNDWIGYGINHVWTGSEAIRNDSPRTHTFTAGQKTTITLNPGMSATTLVMDMFQQFQITDGANVTIQVNPSYSGETSEIIIRSARPDFALFFIKNGSLTLQGTEHTKLVLDYGTNSSGTPMNKVASETENKPKYALIWENESPATTARALSFEYVKFRNSAFGAIDLVKSQMSTVSLTNCTFESTVDNISHGGAIRIRNSSVVEMTKFEVTDCVFNGNQGHHGGAIAVEKGVREFNVSETWFENCTAFREGSGAAGAGIYFKASESTGNNSVVSISECTFKNNMAHGVGGGVAVVDGTYSSISIENCSFENCKTTGYGGAIGLKTNEDGKGSFNVTGNVSITGCTFKKCIAGNLGPNGYQEGTDKVPVTWDHDGDPSTPELDKLNGASGASAIIVGGNIDGKIEIEGTASKPMLFEECLSWNTGGAVWLHNDLKVKGVTDPTTNEFVAVSLRYLNINKCFARDGGSAAYLGSCEVPMLKMRNCVVQSCGYFDLADQNFPDEILEFTTEWCSAPAPEYAEAWATYPKEALYAAADYGGTFRTVGTTACVAHISDCEFKNNRSSGNGGGVYWNASKIVYSDPATKLNPVLTSSLTITNTPIHHNYTVDFGGGIFCEGNATIQSCDIYNNEAGIRGGGIAQSVYSNSGRQLGDSGNGEKTQLILEAVSGGEPVKVYNNIARDGGGISITAALTQSYPYTVKEGTPEADKNKPENWNFRKDFTYEVTFLLGGTHVYENKALRNGGGIYYNATYYKGRTDTPEDGVSWEERQRQVDSYIKNVQIDHGLIYSNIAGYDIAKDDSGGSNANAYAVQVTDASTLKAGDQLIIAAKDYNYAMATSNSTTNHTRDQAVITKDNKVRVTFGMGTEVFTLKTSPSYSGAFGLVTSSDGKYLTSSANESKIKTSDTLNEKSSWTFTINGTTGQATLVSKLANGRNKLCYDSATYCYTNNTYNYNHNDFKPYGIFRLISNSADENVAELVTSTSDLKDGDKIIISTLANYRSMGKRSDSKTEYRHSVVVTPHANKILNFGANTQLVTLVEGSVECPGTFALMLPDGKYLRAAGNGTFKVDSAIVATGSFKITVDPSTGAASIVPSANYSGNAVQYNASEGKFSAYNAGTQYYDVVLYRMESGGNGGGVYVDSNQVNTAATIGQGEKTGSSTVTITGGDIYKNKAYVGNGGGVYLTGVNALCTISGETTTIGAEYQGKTGAKVNLSTDGANTATNRRISKNNYVGGCGGGIAIFGGARIKMEGGYIVNNVASTAGGGVAVHGEKSTMYLHEGYIDGNHASMGGGISLNKAKGDSASTDDQYKYGMYLDGGIIRNNIVFRNQDNVAYGGGICIANSATMKLAGGEVSTNKAVTDTGSGINTYASGQEGGGIAVCQGSELLIQNGSISGNKAYNGGGLAIRGDSTVTLNGSLTTGTDKDGNKDVVLDSQGSITRNYADYLGAGVYMADKTVEGSVFDMVKGYIAYNETSTRSGTKGGGIYLGMWCRIELTGGRIEYNTAHDGGAILGSRAVMNINNGVIKDNTARRNGGGIYDDYGKVTLTGGKIYNNTAGEEGGGIFCWSNNDNSYPAATLIISGGSIFNNSASTKGGGVFVDGGETQKTHGTATITGGDIYSNTTNGDGGGLYVQHATLTMSQNGSIRLNTANNGGGAYLKSSISTISNGTVDSNTASKRGGGIAVVDGGSINFSGGTFKNNEAKGSEGGGIYVKAAEVDISNGTFTNNAGKFGGGIFMDRCTEVEFTGGNVNKNYSNRGAGLFIRSCTVDIQNITVTGNECKADNRYNADSSRYGGGVLIDSPNGASTVTVNGGSFNENKAPHGAGLWIANNSGNSGKCVTVTINGGEVKKNKATGNGGGILLDGGGQVGTSITVNGVTTPGKATTLTMNGGKIAENIAGGNGGGLCVLGRSRATIQTRTLNNVITVGEITENQANNGGGVYVTTGAELTVTNGYITYNQAIQPSDLEENDLLDTAKGHDMSLYGTGGGICVVNDKNASATSKFTLNATENNDDMAIYGNTATFSADDVFSSGNNTKLEIPKVADMNLAGFTNMKPEGWFEDYNTSDTSYKDGLNMIAKQTNVIPVLRYRNAVGLQRMHILPKYVTGDDVSNEVYVNKQGAYVAMTLGMPAAVDDTVVVDFSGSVNIDLRQNDLFITEADFGNGRLGRDYLTQALPEPDDQTVFNKNYVFYSTGDKPKVSYNITDSTAGHLTVSGKFSAWTGHRGVITFSPTRSSLKMDEVLELCYTVLHNGYWYYAKINVIPAATLYFEDHSQYIKYHKTSDSGKDENGELYDILAEWDLVDNDGNTWQKDPDDPRQEQDRPGSYFLHDLDADNIYGYDGVYRTCTKLSNNSAHKVTVGRHKAVDKNNDSLCDSCGVKIQWEHEYEGWNASIDQCQICLNTRAKHTFDTAAAHTCSDGHNYNEYCDVCSKWIGTHTKNARATFTFTGTGFDIISLCNRTTGLVMVSIYEQDSWGDIVFSHSEWETTEPIVTYMVDTWYQVMDQTLYQVPVIKADMNKIEKIGPNGKVNGYWGYGTYTVEIYIAPSFVEGEHAYNGADFYLDAIRIYSPAGYNGGNNQTIHNAYVDDGEGWPTYAELRMMFINEKELTQDPSEGEILFIDMKQNPDAGLTGINKTPTISDYKTWGPNNEVYLAKGQSVAFTLDDSKYGGNVAAVHLGMRALTGEAADVKVQYVERDDPEGLDGEATVIWRTKDSSVGQANMPQLGSTDMYYDVTAAMGKVLMIVNYGKDPIALSNLKVTHTSAPSQSSNLSDMIYSDLLTAKLALNVLTVDELADPVVKPKRPALSFNGMVCYNVFFTAEDLGDLTAADLGLAVFNTYVPDGTVENADEVHLGATEIDGEYMVATDGVHAKYLGDTKYFRAFAKKADGSYVYSKMVSYSAVDYAKNILANSEDVKLKQLVAAMLNYGTEAQKYFGYKTDDLMNKIMTDDDQALLVGFDANSLNAVGKVDASKNGIFAHTGGFTGRRPAISFKGAFEINYFMTPAYAVDGDMTLYIWNEDTYNAVTELTAENADNAVVMTLENGSYTASSGEIIAKYLDKTVYVAAVYESEGVTYSSGVLPYSIAAYCQKPPAGVQDLATAAAIYGCTAKQYFGA